MTVKTKKFTLCCLIVPFFFGLLSVISSILMNSFGNNILEYKMHENTYLRNNSQSFEYLKKPPASVFRSYYFFDIQNPTKIVDGIEKPRLIERGPYVYREEWEKKNIEFIGDQIVKFDTISTIYFEPILSNGSETDLITILNLPLFAMSEKAGLSMLDIMFYTMGSKVFYTKTVKELISGYDDDLMQLAKTSGYAQSSMFSLNPKGNGTIQNSLSVLTGFDFMKNTGIVKTWNDQNKLYFWDTENANMINGTDGSTYPPNRKRNEIFYTFSPEMCRSYSLEYLKDKEIDGFKTYEFHLPKNIFYNSTLNPDNEGFCGNNCLGNGVFNISKCSKGLSAFLSLPNFLNADQIFLDAVDGLNPNKEKHDFLLSFEPITGIPLEAKIRLQLNFYIQNRDFYGYRKIKPVLLPLIWFEMSSNIDQNVKDQIKQIVLIVDIMQAYPKISMITGIIIICVSIFFTLIFLIKNKQKIWHLKKEKNSESTQKMIIVS